jgi:hypothetical protein
VNDIETKADARAGVRVHPDTECGSQAVNTSKVPSLTATTAWSALYAVISMTGGRMMAVQGRGS